MKIFAKLIAIALGFLILTFPMSAQATELGEVNLYEYCQSNYPSKNTEVALIGSKPNADSWRCRIPLTSFASWPSRELTISMNEACQKQYGANAYTLTSDPSSPYAWKCYE